MGEDIIFVSLLMTKQAHGSTELRLAHSWRQGMSEAQALGEAMMAATKDMPGFAVGSHLISRAPLSTHQEQSSAKPICPACHPTNENEHHGAWHTCGRAAFNGMLPSELASGTYHPGDDA